MEIKFEHKPIMVNEIINLLNPQKGQTFVDCTIGGAGHSSLIAEKLGEDGTIIGIDKDETAINVSKERLKKFSNTIFVNRDFKEIKSILDELNVKEIDCALIDLGVSSYQIDTPQRGFSFRFEGPLDMRMNGKQELTAMEVVNTFSKERLQKILWQYGEEDFAPKISSAIVKARANNKIETTLQLKTIIESCLPAKIVFRSGGSSKKTFQALRIFVNSELDNLDDAIECLIDKLKAGGRLAILTFHSLEDRIVKQVFKKNSIGCICPPKTPICICGHQSKIKLITRKPIEASENENFENTRSSCAKLRVIEKL